MKEMMGYCGLDCEKCETRIATITNDDNMRTEVAKKWSKLNNVEITPQMINCYGCRADGIKTYYAEHICQISKCASAKQYCSCASCTSVDDCATLKEITSHSQEAIDNLHQVK